MIDLKAAGLDAALAQPNGCMAQDQDFPELRALKGDVYQMANRPVDAVAAYTEAAKATPSSLLTDRRRGGAASLRAKGRDANKLLADWMAKHPDDMAAAEMVADIDIAAGNLIRPPQNISSKCSNRSRMIPSR